MNQPQITKLKTACNRDCPDACGIVATLENDRVVRIQGDPDHPVTQGFLCKRTSRYLKRQYSPDRITTPLIREGESWKEASLDAALDVVAKKMLHLRDTLGPASIMNYRCGGSMGMMKYVTDYFFQEFGPVTIKSGDICAGAGEAAQETDFGTQDCNDIFDLYNSKTIFLWGKNVYVSQVHLLPILKKAKANGTRLVLIDPVQHRTASLCDDYIQVAPGGDAALAFGISQILEAEGAWDPNVANFCENLDEYKSLVQSKTPGEWATIAGVTKTELKLLAQAYSNGPSAILIGWGMQRRRNGAAIIRAVDALATVSGNVGVSGGGASFYFPRRGAFDISFKDDSLAPRSIPEPLLGQALMEAQDPPIEMVFISAANPVATVPDSLTIQKALRDRFTVVVDSFMTDTAKCADVFLPTVSLLEDDDLIGAYGHHYLNEVRPVVEPPPGVLTDYGILQKLAPKVGIEGWFKDDVETWKQRIAGDNLSKIRSGIAKNPNAKQVLFADRVFPTPSGKVNLIHQYEHPPTRCDKEYPLSLMAISSDESQASQWPAETQVGPAPMIVNPESAQGHSDGDIVKVESSIGHIQARLVFDNDQRSDLALMEKGGWLSAGRCSNAITPAELTDAGECAVYYETPVRIVAK